MLGRLFKNSQWKRPEVAEAAFCLISPLVHLAQYCQQPGSSFPAFLSLIWRCRGANLEPSVFQAHCLWGTAFPIKGLWQFTDLAPRAMSPWALPYECCALGLLSATQSCQQLPRGFLSALKWPGKPCLGSWAVMTGKLNILPCFPENTVSHFYVKLLHVCWLLIPEALEIVYSAAGEENEEEKTSFLWAAVLGISGFWCSWLLLFVMKEMMLMVLRLPSCLYR